MAQQVDGAAMPLDTEKVGIKGYLAFFLTIIFFSGVFSGSEGWWRVFDFTVLNGSFGHVTGTQTFRGAGGTGAKDGFLFALELAPSVILSLGIIAITDGLGGLRAAQSIDDAHPETIAWHSRHLLTGADRPTCKIPTPRRV